MGRDIDHCDLDLEHVDELPEARVFVTVWCLWNLGRGGMEGEVLVRTLLCHMSCLHEGHCCTLGSISGNVSSSQKHVTKDASHRTEEVMRKRWWIRLFHYVPGYQVLAAGPMVTPAPLAGRKISGFRDSLFYLELPKDSHKNLCSPGLGSWQLLFVYALEP